jgi:hypothetical protein
MKPAKLPTHAPGKSARERFKLISLAGRLHTIVMRRRGRGWIMQAPRLATPEEIQSAAADAGYPEDFFTKHADDEKQHQEDQWQRHAMRHGFSSPPTPRHAGPPPRHPCGYANNP